MSVRQTLRASLLRAAERYSAVQSFVERCREWKLKARRQELVEYSFGIDNIELTNRCPMRCVMCARTHAMTRKQGNMPLSLFRRIVEQLVECNPEFVQHHTVWLHHFGESLTHPDFDQAISFAREKGLRVGLSINPLVLTYEIARRLISAAPYELLVSLDGHDDDSFRRIRGIPDAYEKSKQNFLGFLEEKLKQDSNIRVTLSMLDFSLNEDSVKQMAEYWRSRKGVDEFLLKPFISWDGVHPEVNEFVTPAVTDQRSSRRFVSCNRPWDMITVTWDGRVVPCCYDYDAKIVLGNAHDQPLAEIWNGGRMKELRREFMSNQVTNPLCSNCRELYRFYG